MSPTCILCSHHKGATPLVLSSSPYCETFGYKQTKMLRLWVQVWFVGSAQVFDIAAPPLSEMTARSESASLSQGFISFNSSRWSLTVAFLPSRGRESVCVWGGKLRQSSEHLKPSTERPREDDPGRAAAGQPRNAVSGCSALVSAAGRNLTERRT